MTTKEEGSWGGTSEGRRPATEADMREGGGGAYSSSTKGIRNEQNLMGGDLEGAVIYRILIFGRENESRGMGKL